MPVESAPESFLENYLARHAIRRTGTDGMRCYFDIAGCLDVHLDLDGIEVSDLNDTIAQARRAIDELQEREDLQARFGAGACLLLRVRTESLLCVIPLDKRTK